MEKQKTEIVDDLMNGGMRTVWANISNNKAMSNSEYSGMINKNMSRKERKKTI